jgi:hypothetical protein
MSGLSPSEPTLINFSRHSPDGPHRGSRANTTSKGPIPSTIPAISAKIKTDSSIHAIAGMPSAMTSP